MVALVVLLISGRLVVYAYPNVLLSFVVSPDRGAVVSLPLKGMDVVQGFVVGFLVTL